MMLSSTSVSSPSVDSPIPRGGTQPVFQSRRQFAKVFADMVGTSRFPSVQAISVIPPETLESVQQPKIDKVERSILGRIRELGTYAAGWNRSDSVPPSNRTVDEAVQFAQILDLASLHLPHISAADDGEINFWWDIDGLYIDLGFFGDGFYSFYAKLPNGTEIIEDEMPVSRTLPSELLSSLQRTTHQPIYAYKSEWVMVGDVALQN